MLNSTVSIVVLVVLYKLSIHESSSLRSILKATRANKNIQVVVYDNSPDVATDLDDYKLIYHHDRANSGLASAYNFGLNYSKDHHFDWLVLFDQDTTVPANYFTKLQKTIDHNVEIANSPAVLVPSVDYKGRSISPFHIESALFQVKTSSSSGVLAAINSGIALNVGELTRADFDFDMRYPVDFLDYQTFWKFDQMGIQIGCFDVQLNQDLSVGNYRSMSNMRFHSFITAEARFIQEHYQAYQRKYQKRIMLRLAKMLLTRVQFFKIVDQIKVMATKYDL